MTPEQAMVVASLLWGLPGDLTVAEVRENIRTILVAIVGERHADAIIAAAAGRPEEDE